ncbi:restriction endonuclease subunit S [Vibrio fluvialis]|uniref:restriction endonuclease subunit S n=1 Tax=Vibrio fluvialis TaxID=676 RepID=UPI00192A725D|nr:restriction endonuclease subunit S [Vibrio fluvialis]MBL4284649.1 restriction endonuclease subunit S [Vibrio fluvialis]
MSTKWERVALGNVLTLQRGHDLPSQQRQAGTVPIVSSSGVTDFHNEAKVQPPGVVTGRYGTIGEVFYIDEPYWPLNTALYVKDFKGNNPKFIAYLLEGLNLKEMNAAGAVPGINRNHLHKLKVLFPKVHVMQERIVALISAYDDLIENNLERIKLLEEMAQITYEEWFVRMRFPGYEEVELDLETGLPIGWKTQTLRELTSYINRGVAPKYVESEGFPVINQKCIREHLVNFTESRLTASDHKVPKDKLLQSLDILVNSTGTGTLGRVAQLFDCPDKATVDTHVTIVRPSGDVSAYWLGRSLEAIEPFIVNLGKGATNQQELGRNDLADIVKLNTPTEDLMARFDDFARPIFETITNLLNQNGLLKEARDILLPRLMTGMIDIDKVELPEALLERINKQNNNETNIG